MIAKVSKRLIKRFGSKGDVILKRVSGVYDEDTMENTNTEKEIPLLAYVGKAPSDQATNTTKWFSSIKVLIAIDSDFDGVIDQEDRILFNSIEYDISSIVPVSAQGKIAYIEAICNG